jgi:hypothetical protein
MSSGGVDSWRNRVSLAVARTRLLTVSAHRARERISFRSEK